MCVRITKTNNLLCLLPWEMVLTRTEEKKRKERKEKDISILLLHLQSLDYVLYLLLCLPFVFFWKMCVEFGRTHGRAGRGRWRMTQIAWSQPILPSFHMTSSPSSLSPYLSLAFMLLRRALCTPTITGFSFLLPFSLVGIETQLVHLPLFSSPVSLLLQGAWRRKTEKITKERAGNGR